MAGGRRDGRVKCVEFVLRLGEAAEFPAVGAGQHKRDAGAHEVGGQAPGDTNRRGGECRFLLGVIVRRPSGGHGYRAKIGTGGLAPHAGGGMGHRTAEFALNHHRTKAKEAGFRRHPMRRAVATAASSPSRSRIAKYLVDGRYVRMSSGARTIGVTP